VVSAARPIRLVARADGGARTAGAVEDADRPQLALIRGYKDDLTPIVAAYGEVEVFIRPATPLPEPESPRCPELSKKQKRARLKWLGRDTARIGLVNRELPR
jgi:hypothetical protein